MDQKYFKLPFAISGDKTEIPDAPDPAGFVNFTAGYPIGYQGDRTSDPSAKAIERNKMNWLFYAFSQALKQYQEFGVPEFITADDNGGSPFAYSQNAVVRFSTGTAWITRRSTVNNNTQLPTGANWVDYDPLGLIASQADAEAGVSNTSLMSPLRTKQALDAIPSGLVGSLLMWPMPNLPAGYLWARGGTASRTTDARLFSVYGTFYGDGDGVSTFGLPDFRGVVPRGLGAGSGIDGDRVLGTLQNDMVGAHSHPINDPLHKHDIHEYFLLWRGVSPNGFGNSARQIVEKNPVETQYSTTGISVLNNTGTETRMINRSVNFIIKR